MLEPPAIQVLPLIFYKLGKYVQGVSHALGLLESRGCEGVCYATAIYKYTLQDALFICYKQSADNTPLVAFSQRAINPRLIEDETFNDCGIINNLKDYVDEQEEPDSLRADEIYEGKQFPTNWEKHFLKIDT
ncbi:uncharacterized protein TNCV_2244891 [Trichonephila clavipes]|nr:uncharacterized protein TNCV_2244891 [Trichonephila clavipes]